MSYSLASLRKNSSLDKIKAALESKNKPRIDERFWQPTLDKAGNGFAVIRFLPSPAVDGETGDPVVQYFQHAFKGAGGWFIENCPTTLENDCPVCKDNGRLWETKIKANEDLARDRKRKLKFVSNVLVIQDPHHPENNGQIKLFTFGKKICDKIYEKVSPPNNEYEQITPVNVFDPENGANFTLRISREGQFLNYDKSTFGEKTSLGMSDSEFEQKIWNKEYSLKEFLSPNQFKDYVTLEGRLNKVLASSNNDTKSVEKNDVKPPVVEAQHVLVNGGVAGPVDEGEPPFEAKNSDDVIKYFKQFTEE